MFTLEIVLSYKQAGQQGRWATRQVGQQGKQANRASRPSRQAGHHGRHTNNAGGPTRQAGQQGSQAGLNNVPILTAHIFAAVTKIINIYRNIDITLH